MIFLLLFGVPLVLGAVVQYMACRFPKRPLWRWVPPLLATAVTGLVALHRYHGWSDGPQKAPVEQLLFIPGLPALGAFVGLWLGWRVWKRLWRPRVVKDKKREGGGGA